MTHEERILKLGIARTVHYTFEKMYNERVFYVARKYSHTDRRMLFKILTRAQVDERLINNELDFFQSLEPKIPPEDFFIIEVKKNYDPFG